MYLTGSTIKLIAKFTDENNEPITPTTVHLILYTVSKVPIGNPVAITESIVPGTYEYLYTIPTDNTAAKFYEFKGIVDGKQVIAREVIDSVWVL